MADSTDPLSSGTVVVPPSTIEYREPTGGAAYELVRKLGGGAFGSVWLARDVKLGREVALKTVRTAGSGTQLDMLEEEGRKLAGLRPHPHVIDVYAWWADADGQYLVLRYVPGGSLADRLERDGPLAWADAAGYLADAADGLAHVHAHGLVHRDVKPANLLRDTAGGRDAAVLTDFGVSARSAAGGVAGTPPYMAPEALTGRAEPPADVFALAATGFHLLTGGLPFPGFDRSLPDPDPRLAGVPAGVEAVLRAGLHPSPGRRPTTVAFATDLRAELHRGLADAAAAAGDGGLRLEVLWVADDGFARPVAAVPPPDRLAARDLKRVPPPTARAGLRTGDRVRVRVHVSRPGYLTVLNVGPTGNVNLLFPEAPGPGGRVPAGAVDVLDAELTAPAGRERVLAVWTPDLRPVAPADWSGPAAGSGLAARDLKRVWAAAAGAATAVVELAHAGE